MTDRLQKRVWATHQWIESGSVSSELATFCSFFWMAGDFLDDTQMASGWLRINFAPATRKSHPSAAAHQLTTRKFATFASNLEKVALRSPGTKVHVEILSSKFLKFQRVRCIIKFNLGFKVHIYSHVCSLEPFGWIYPAVWVRISSLSALCTLCAL